MSQYKGYKVLLESLFFVVIVSSVISESQDTTTVKPGRYVPELHGGLRGKYVPDESGKYVHKHRPYDGGYGDRGLKYVHDASGNIFVVKADGGPGILPFSQKDRLRFMVDFNYDGSGFQIIKFEWLRDGDENYQFNYASENQLFNGNNGNYNSAAQSPASKDGSGGSDDESDVHIDGEYDELKGYDYSFTDRKVDSSTKKLQNAIKDVLEYIEVNILPTL